MKLKSLAVVSLAVCLSAGISVHASEIKTPTDNEPKVENKIEKKEHGFRKRHNSGIFKVAKQIGISKEEMKAAKEENKNFFELAKKKGYSEQQVKEMMIKNKFEHIDAAVEKGKITKEQAGEIKSKLKEKISNWDGSFKKHEDIKREDSKKEDKQ